MNKHLKESLANAFGSLIPCEDLKVTQKNGWEIWGKLDRCNSIMIASAGHSMTSGRSNALMFKRSLDMLELLWEEALAIEEIGHLPIRAAKTLARRFLKIKRLFLSLYSQIHHEEITWDELKKKVEE